MRTSLSVGDNLTVADTDGDSALLFDSHGNKYWTDNAPGLNLEDNLTVGEVQEDQVILYANDGSKYTISLNQ